MKDNNTSEILETLQYLEAHGKINYTAMRDLADDMRKKEFLNMHQYQIWQGTNGKWYTYVPDEEKGRRLIKRISEQAITDYIIDFYKKQKEKSNSVTFQDCYFTWKDRQKKCGISDSTINKYESDYRRYFENDNDICNKPIEDIDEKYIEEYIFRLFDRLTIRYQAFRQMFSMFNGICKKAKKDRIINDNPCDYIDIDLYKRRCEDTVYDPEKRVLDEEGCNKLFAMLQKDHIEKRNYIPSYAVELALLTGMRAGELAYLQWEHIKSDKGYILICGSEKYDQKKKEYWDDLTKTKKQRRIPLTPEIKAFFDNLKKIEMEYGYLTPYVFSNENGRIHRGTLCSCGQNKCKQAGTTAGGLQVLRRTFNSELRTSGVSSVIASSILGHSQRVNERYYTYDTSNMDYKTEVMHEINRRMRSV